MQLTGEFSLVGALPEPRMPGFHLVFPGSLRRWLTAPVLSIYIYTASGPGGTRTLDPHNAIVVRSQLRYRPISTCLGAMLVELRGLEPLTSTVRL